MVLLLVQVVLEVEELVQQIIQLQLLEQLILEVVEEVVVGFLEMVVMEVLVVLEL